MWCLCVLANNNVNLPSFLIFYQDPSSGFPTIGVEMKERCCPEFSIFVDKCRISAADFEGAFAVLIAS